MSRIALRCSSLRPVSASRNPDQFSSLGNQYSGSIPPIILGWPWIHGLPGWLVSIRWKRKRHRDWVLGLFLNRRSDLSIRNGVLLYKQLIHPMVDYGCPCGVPSLAPISGNGRCFNPSVLELPPLHLGTLLTSKFMMIWESLSLLTTSYLWEIRLNVNWFVEPLSYAAWRICTLTKCWPGFRKGGR